MMDTTMELDDLKQAWQALGQQLLQQNALQLQQYRESKLRGIGKTLRPLFWGQVVQTIFGIPFIGLAALLWIQGGQSADGLPWTTIVAGIVVQLYGIATIAMADQTLHRIGEIEYAQPIVEIHKRLATLRRTYIVNGMLAGLPWWWFGLAFGGVAAIAPVAWFWLLRPYQKDRILTFLDPESDPLGTGWNIIQSKIAIGGGGFTGKGWGEGSQSHLNYIPEHTTDFIFAVLSEEFGWIGVATVLALYLVVIGRCLWIASQSRDSYSRLLAGATGLAFFVYVLVNGGMISGLLPVVGVPMPLISYGGTSAVSLLAGMGLLVMYSVGFDHGSRFADHGRNMLIALGVLFFVAQVPPQRLMALALPLYLGGVLLLLGVELFGITRKGATRWLDIQVTVIQPSEVAVVKAIHVHDGQQVKAGSVIGRSGKSIDGEGAINSKLQQAELDYLMHSEAGLKTIAENYVGLPLDFGQ